MAKKRDTDTKAPVVEKKKSRAPTAKAESLQALGNLTSDTSVAPAAPVAAEKQEQAPRQRKIDSKGRALGTGRRKNAIARVWLKPGTGKVTVNDRDQAVYF